LWATGPRNCSFIVYWRVILINLEPRVGNVVQSLFWFFLKTSHEQRAI